MISVLLDQNNLIKNLLTAKSNNFKSLFVSAKHSRPYISIGIHFDLINSKMTSSNAFLPILPKIASIALLIFMITLSMLIYIGLNDLNTQTTITTCDFLFIHHVREKGTDSILDITFSLTNSNR